MASAHPQVSTIVAEPRAGVSQRLAKLVYGPVRRARTLRGVQRHLAREKPELLVGDVAMAGLTDLVKTLRLEHPTTNVLFLTNGVDDRVDALLEFGAVDVLRRPFSDAQLELRLEALAARPPALRRPAAQAPPALAGLHDPSSGRIDAKRVSKAFGVSLRGLSRALGRKPQTLSKTPAAPALQAELAHYRRVFELLLSLLGDAPAARRWLNAPLPDFDGERPIALIEQGQIETVRSFLEMMYAGGPS